MSTHAEGSPIATNGQQMYELKRVHAVQAISRITENPALVNQYYKIGEVTQDKPFKRATENRLNHKQEGYIIFLHGITCLRQRSFLFKHDISTLQPSKSHKSHMRAKVWAEISSR